MSGPLAIEERSPFLARAVEAVIDTAFRPAEVTVVSTDEAGVHHVTLWCHERLPLPSFMASALRDIGACHINISVVLHSDPDDIRDGHDLCGHAMVDVSFEERARIAPERLMLGELLLPDSGHAAPVTAANAGRPA
jgi:hypothetical protein